MTTFAYTVSDSATMVRRSLLHMVRYPVLSLSIVMLPVVFLLLFVFVFGDALGAGISPSGDRADYLVYVVPGLLVMTVAGGTQGTAISVAMDMTEGIIARFRTMAISRAAVLTGHVIGSVIQTMLGIVLVMIVALLIGFRADGGVAGWLAALGVIMLISFALTWLAVGMGIFSKTVEGASDLPLILVLLPVLGSGFVPTDSMPAGVALFAEWQPFTPFIETVRGLLMGTPIGDYGWLTLAWCVVIGVGGYLWSVTQYRRKSVRS